MGARSVDVVIKSENIVVLLDEVKVFEEKETEGRGPQTSFV